MARKRPPPRQRKIKNAPPPDDCSPKGGQRGPLRNAAQKKSANKARNAKKTKNVCVPPPHRENLLGLHPPTMTVRKENSFGDFDAKGNFSTKNWHFQKHGKGWQGVGPRPTHHPWGSWVSPAALPSRATVEGKAGGPTLRANFACEECRRAKWRGGGFQVKADGQLWGRT